jgi:UTP--glucose-1-phosphate uridylyltransferase
MQILPHIDSGRGGEIQLPDALKELLKTEEIYAVTMECTGYDTGNILSWLETNIALALESDQYGPGLRDWLREQVS